MLRITNLHAKVGETEILKGLSLHVKPGEVHAIMGPNGAGKSTLAYTLAGRDGYDATSGTIDFDGVNIVHEDPSTRAAMGLFLSMQYPVEIPGVSTLTFLKTALNAVRKARNEDELDAISFLKKVRAKAKELGVSEEMLKRAVNVGFSGGEKKRNEMLQMAILEPKVAILDETDSGLDIDALKVVADGINAMRDEERCFVMITHYQRLLDYVKPDYVHILADGRIVRSGGPELAHALEEDGYDKVIEAA